MKKMSLEQALRDKESCRLLNPPGIKTHFKFKTLTLEKLTTKIINKILIFDLVENPISLDKWYRQSQININNWENCFNNIYYLTKEYKIQQKYLDTCIKL